MITNPSPFHSSLDPKQAIVIQKELCEKIELTPLTKDIKTIAGCDISFNKESNKVYAGIIVFNYPELNIIEQSVIETEVFFPYIPGLLSFREIPPLLNAWDRLNQKPDLVMLDGQGIAHPRRIGIASHFGLIVDKPTIGCAKSKLIGKYDDVPTKKGSFSYLFDKDDIIGAVLRTKEKVKPVFVSPGNKITLKESIEIVMNCLSHYRIPEPTRQAHLLVNALRKKLFSTG